MDKTEALALAHSNAATEFASAVMAQRQAMNHLEGLIERMKREAADGHYYSDLNLPKAAADVSREQERIVSALKQMQFIDHLLADN